MLDLAKFGPALKKYYSNTAVENMTYSDHPAYAMVEKDVNFYGEDMPLPIIYGNPQGRSASFAIAKANKGSSKYAKFTLTRFKDYSLASIDNETAEASETNSGAFFKALTREIDGAIQSAKNSAASDMFGNGSGKIGRIALGSTVAGQTTIQLENVESSVLFESGMSLELSVSYTNPAQAKKALAGGQKLKIVAVDRSSGIVTVDTDLDVAVPTVAAGDYIFVEGDYWAKMPGFEAWLPVTAPTTGDSFFNLDRSVDPTRLAGQRFDGSSMPIEEALIKSASLVQREGGKPDNAFTSYDKYSDLEIALGAKVQYVMPTAAGRADISFRGIILNTNKGTMAVIADAFCPSDRAYVLTMKTWKLYSLKQPIRILDLDGNKMLRENDADAVELRIGGYKVLGCNAPGWNCNVQL